VKRLLTAAWVDIAGAVQALSVEPKIKRNTQPPLLIVRHHRAEFAGIEDIRPSSLPARMGVAR